MKSNAKFRQKASRKPFQEIQDDIFRSMSADKKIDIGSQLWRLAKELVGDKIRYGTNRSPAFTGKNFKTS